MTKTSPTPPEPPPPTAGGSYILDPVTGERRRAGTADPLPRPAAPDAVPTDAAASPEAAQKGPRK